MKPTLVIVSGAPGSGKTTLAHALAPLIGCPAICRDEIKEGMARSHGADFRGGHGDDLTQRTLPLFFEVISTLIAGGVTVVAEAAFQDRVWRPNLEPMLGRADLRVVRCAVHASVSFQRAATRAASNEHRVRAHGDSTLGKDVAAWADLFDSFEHVSLPVPWIEVDTTSGYDPPLEELIAFIDQD
ncbi:MAG TPA: AAA family ATPase [Vicinamibacterales bacterium]|nr:AAA family ATPase [Vicinamibacterales bacterium]